MTKKKRIAIIGCGIAGTTCALFLKKQGHEVTLFEKVANPSPVGAGFLLQPGSINTMACT